MYIKVSDVPHEGLELQFKQKLEDFDATASADLYLKRIGPDVLINGTIMGTLSFECGRCLETFDQEISVPVETVFTADVDIEADEFELSEEELTNSLIDAVIDLGLIVEEQILLNIPMRPLCSETCKGLCPECGVNLNSTSCGCSRQKVDPRLEGLKKFFNKGENNNG